MGEPSRWVTVQGPCVRAAFVARRQPEPVIGLLAGARGILAVGRNCVHFVLSDDRKPICPRPPGSGPPQLIRDAALTDLDGDGRAGLVLLLRGDAPRAAGRLVGVNLADGRQADLSVEPLEGVWALDSADVDGDGRQELLVGVYKQAYFDPAVARRLRVYSYMPGEGRLVPRWRGTRMARRMLDFAAGPADKDGRVLLASLEDTGKGKRTIALYEWRFFGFWVAHELPAPAGSSRLARIPRPGGEASVVAIPPLTRGRAIDWLFKRFAPTSKQKGRVGK